VLACAGLLLRSFALLQGTSPGFDPHGALTMDVTLPQVSYPPKSQAQAQFPQAVLARLASLPGVAYAGAAALLPLSDFAYSEVVSIEGKPLPPADEAPEVTKYVVSPAYLLAMGIPLRRGRHFTDGDSAVAPAVVIVSEAAGRRFWPGEDPVGKRITASNLWDRSGGAQIRWSTVVGVAGDVRSERMTEAGGPAVYYPLAQSPVGSLTLVVRARTDPRQLVEPVRRAVWQVDPRLPVYDVETLEQRVSRAEARPRLSSVLLGAFAAFGLLLSALGAFAVISSAVAQHTKESGIRIALGAPRSQVVGWFVKQGMIPVLAGMAVGLAASFAATISLEGLLYGLTRTDPATFAVVAATLLAVALLACALPALRAVRVDPAVVLRRE